MSSIIILCHKCDTSYLIDEKNWKKLKDFDCPECGEEPYGNWLIIGDSERKPNGKIDKLFNSKKYS